MISIYIENSSKLFSIKREEALPALESQVLEIFSKINSFENALLGLLIDTALEIKIQSYNKYIWKVESIDIPHNKISFNYYSTQRVILLIKNIYAV
ncbi:MAG: hypothetical protein J6581_05610 [Apibacter sp.]|jgi:hypothetical protein|nr:hypothetical protein [Apibacter sp.]